MEPEIRQDPGCRVLSEKRRVLSLPDTRLLEPPRSAICRRSELIVCTRDVAGDQCRARPSREERLRQIAATQISAGGLRGRGKLAGLLSVERPPRPPPPPPLAHHPLQLAGGVGAAGDFPTLSAHPHRPPRPLPA